MALDRYNSQVQRFKKLQKLSKESILTSKQYREIELLKSSIDAYKESYPLEKMISMAKYIEELNEINRATASDLARLEILKEKILKNEKDNEKRNS